MRRHPDVLYLGLGLAASVAYFALHESLPDFSAALYLVVAWATPVAIAAGILLYRPRAALAWWLLAASQLLWAAGDVVWELIAVDDVAPFPSLADAVYLSGYALFAAGLLLLARRLSPDIDRGHLADATIVGLAIAMLVWPWVFEPNLEAGGQLATLVTIAYPVFDVAFATLLFGLSFGRGSGTRAVRLLAVSVLLLFAADIAYSAPALAGLYEVGHWADTVWLAAYVTMGAAALHRSVAAAPEPAAETGPRLPRGRLVAVGVALVALPAAPLVDHLAHGLDRADAVFFMLAAFAAAILVVVRVGLLLSQIERLRTAASASERKFRAIFESAGVGISIGDGGMMSETNEAYQRLLGYSGDELAQMHFLEVTHPDDRERDVEPTDELESGEREAYVVEKRYLRRDGSSFWANVTITRAKGEDFGIAIVEDATARRELEEQLRQAQKMEAVGQLAGGIAHDFNNLLMAISGYVELALARLGPEERARQDIEAVAGAAGRAAQLTSQLLAFSRRQVVRARAVDLNAAVEGAQALARRVIESDVELGAELGENVPAVQADPGQLDQIVLNLVLNARDAMPGGGRLTVRTRAARVDDEAAGTLELAPGDYAVLEVADTGTGMDEATRSRAFEPFFTTKGPGRGSGLGLSMVYGAVRQIGGAVEIESALGEGTVVRIFLPQAREPVERPSGPEEQRLPEELTSPAGDRVLLVEDEPAVGDLVRDVLEGAGYAVALARDPVQGLAMAEASGPFDLLVTDLLMPQMNGRRMAEEIVARSPETRVIYMSGYPGPAVLERGLLEPGTPFIEKPFALADFLALVRSAVAPEPAARP